MVKTWNMIDCFSSPRIPTYIQKVTTDPLAIHKRLQALKSKSRSIKSDRTDICVDFPWYSMKFDTKHLASKLKTVCTYVSQKWFIQSAKICWKTHSWRSHDNVNHTGVSTIYSYHSLLWFSSEAVLINPLVLTLCKQIPILFVMWSITSFLSLNYILLSGVLFNTIFSMVYIACLSTLSVESFHWSSQKGYVICQTKIL